MIDTSEVPNWLSALLTEKFFNACIIHEEAKKNEQNIFCLDCCKAICPDCLFHHRSHRLLQIRRYVYHDVVRVEDAAKLIDCAQVQSYTINSAKVVFLNQRPLSRPPKCRGTQCFTCYRYLHESSLFCSISCKLHHLLKSGYKISSYLPKWEFLVLPEPSPEDEQMATDSLLELTGSLKTESGSSACITDLTACTATTEIVKKKRSNLSGFRSNVRPVCRPVCEISETLMNRRKGTPHRSPLF